MSEKQPYTYAIPRQEYAVVKGDLQRVPIWHDGALASDSDADSKARPQPLLSGEIRCELTTLSPLLVGWERRSKEDDQDPMSIDEAQLRSSGLQDSLAPEKSVLCPLRLPKEMDPQEPVVIPADSLKGMLRHELGLLTDSPLERVDKGRFFENRSKTEDWGLFPTTQEREPALQPSGLTFVRRLFGYTGDNDGSAKIGEGNYSQLMGHLFFNSAIEVVSVGNPKPRFLPPVYLKVLAQPMSFENRMEKKARKHRKARGYEDEFVDVDDSLKKKVGRKVYLDYSGTYEDKSPENVKDNMSTVALSASEEGVKFRFTLRFRDIERLELGVVLLALCPNQMASITLGGAQRYCSKLGYARPLGWGSVQVEAKELWLLEEELKSGDIQLARQGNVQTWLKDNCKKLLAERKPLQQWFDLHRKGHPDAGPYLPFRGRR